MNGIISLQDPLEETLYLSSIPGMKESIEEGMKVNIEDCVSELPW